MYAQKDFYYSFPVVSRLNCFSGLVHTLLLAGVAVWYKSHAAPAVSYVCMRHYATSACGLKLLVRGCRLVQITSNIGRRRNDSGVGGYERCGQESFFDGVAHFFVWRCHMSLHRLDQYTGLED